MKQHVFLLADDDSDDSEMFLEALSTVDQKAVCHHVENGPELFKKLTGLSANPDLIFLDINMPGMSGWECLKRLKGDRNYSQTPVVIYSTASQQKEIDAAVALGAVCFLTKPVDFRHLIEVLSIIVKNVGASLPHAISRFCGKPSNGN